MTHQIEAQELLFNLHTSLLYCNAYKIPESRRKCRDRQKSAFSVETLYTMSVDFTMIQQRSLRNSSSFITYKIPKQFHTTMVKFLCSLSLWLS